LTSRFDRKEKIYWIFFNHGIPRWVIVSGSRERLDLGLGERKNYGFLYFLSVIRNVQYNLLAVVIGGQQQRDDDSHVFFLYNYAHAAN
jgi:hypothetical protein